VTPVIGSLRDLLSAREASFEGGENEEGDLAKLKALWVIQEKLQVHNKLLYSRVR
jgi:hypothetical protein